MVVSDNNTLAGSAPLSPSQLDLQDPQIGSAASGMRLHSDDVQVASNDDVPPPRQPTRMLLAYLPPEVVIDIARSLPSQRDRLRMAQVCQTWRQSLHSSPQLWTTLYLKIYHYHDLQNCLNKDLLAEPEASFAIREVEKRQLELFNNRIEFYETRLPPTLPGGQSSIYRLDNLSIYSAGTGALQTMKDSKSPVVSRLYNMCTSGHRFTSKLKSLSISGFLYDDIAHIASDWFSASNAATITCMRIALLQEESYKAPMILKFVSRFPLASSLQVQGTPRDAEDDAGWPETIIDNQPAKTKA